MNRLPTETRSAIYRALVEGVGIRSISRILDVHTKSIDRVLEQVGDFSISHIDGLTNLPVRAIQADELWGFVQTKQFELTAFELSDLEDGKKGRLWIYLAVCADSRFILTYHIGSHMKPDVTAFIEKVSQKLPRDAFGNLTHEITFTTDALRSYHTVVEETFGASLNYGQVTKQFGKKKKSGDVIKLVPDKERGPGDRYIGEKREALIGNPKQADIHTCYIERQNANARMQNRRLSRKTYGFSKKFKNLERQLAIWIMYRNYIWVPTNKRKIIDHGTAAMALGIEDNLWSSTDLIELSDCYLEKCKAEQSRSRLKATNDEPSDSIVEIIDESDLVSLPTHWVYHHKKLYQAKVHAAQCVNCCDGRGKTDGATPSGEWYPFFDIDEARKFAEQIEPHNNSDCRMCVTKEYQKRDHRF